MHRPACSVSPLLGSQGIVVMRHSLLNAFGCVFYVRTAGCAFFRGEIFHLGHEHPHSRLPGPTVSANGTARKEDVLFTCWRVIPFFVTASTSKSVAFSWLASTRSRRAAFT